MDKINLNLVSNDSTNSSGLLSKGPAPQHPTIGIYNVNGNELHQIQKEVSIEIKIENGNDTGYHSFSNAWWFNLNCPYAYSYIDIDSLYPKQYYDSEGIGHPNKKFAQELYDYMQTIFSSMFSRKFTSILELGTGGGEITYQFHMNNLDYVAVEGSKEGCNKLVANGIDPNRIVNSNLKMLKPLNRRFDMVMCTEVIEHVEPFFASKVIESCTTHADSVWFSAADRNRRGHYHHCNEISIEAWDNIFAYFGFNYYIKLNNLHSRANRLYINSAIINQ